MLAGGSRRGLCTPIGGYPLDKFLILASLLQPFSPEGKEILRLDFCQSFPHLRSDNTSLRFGLLHQKIPYIVHELAYQPGFVSRFP